MVKKKEREERLNLVRKYAAQNMPNLPYHNFTHALDVDNAVQVLGRKELLIYEFDDFLIEHDLFLLRTAAFMHDIIYIVNSRDNEERSAELSEQILPQIGYNYSEVEGVKKLILSTKIPTHPQSKLEEIICDADVDNLGRDDFFDKCDLLRQEAGVEDYNDWYKQVLSFLEKHCYYTKAAKALRQKGFEKNRRMLKKIVQQ